MFFLRYLVYVLLCVVSMSMCFICYGGVILPPSLLTLVPPRRVSTCMLPSHSIHTLLVFLLSRRCSSEKQRAPAPKMLHMWFPFCVSMSHDESATLGGTAEGVQSSPISSFPAARFAHPHSEINFAVSNKLCCVHFLFQHYVHSLSRTPTSPSFFQPCPIFFVMLFKYSVFPLLVSLFST
jgi:hypothetical protein